jgi:hypothetical protein
MARPQRLASFQTWLSTGRQTQVSKGAQRSGNMGLKDFLLLPTLSEYPVDFYFELGTWQLTT